MENRRPIAPRTSRHRAKPFVHNCAMITGVHAVPWLSRRHPSASPYAAFRTSPRRLGVGRFRRQDPPDEERGPDPDPAGREPRGQAHRSLSRPPEQQKPQDDLGFRQWQVLGSNQRRLSRRFYRQQSIRMHHGQ